MWPVLSADPDVSDRDVRWFHDLSEREWKELSSETRDRLRDVVATQRKANRAYRIWADEEFLPQLEPQDCQNARKAYEALQERLRELREELDDEVSDPAA